MFTDKLRSDATTYASNLVAGLRDLGIEAAVETFERNPPWVVSGKHSRFIVHFRAAGDRNETLRVLWDTPEGRANRPAGSTPTEKTIRDVADAIRRHDEQEAFTLSEKARVDAVHEEIEGIRLAFGLVEDAGLVRIEETSYRSGRFEVHFKTTTPEQIRDVLKSLKCAGHIP